uniref:Cytochrome b-c1 complex subunit 7 n=1 Tax=Caligus rogercresseyi TaxID=217165 RepID=C1BNI1_CALRO|nr:Cytochrome b-c1 complex subunit 7 [Caligus rogercresseyi]
MMNSTLKLVSSSAFKQSVRGLKVPDSVRRWAFTISGFNQYGLYRNDLCQETPEVLEAIRRMPMELQDERAFRIQRAMQLSLQKSVLPKSEWVSFEENEDKGHYLDDLLEEVFRESEEKRNWAKRG